MSTSLQHKADHHRERHASALAFNGHGPEYDHINMKAGQQAAARHDHILLLVCLEAGDGAAERVAEELEEQISYDEFGDDGCAAYFEARTSIADLDRDADCLGSALIAVERFAKAAARAVRAVRIRRAL